MIPWAMFVATNLSHSLSLVESELFGHRKGAFTGALKDHEGLFSCCPEYGMVFSDEIGSAIDTPDQTPSSIAG